MLEMYTQSNSVHNNTERGDVPLQTPWMSGWAFEGTVTRVPVNAFKINIDSTNGNMLSIKADFY